VTAFIKEMQYGAACNICLNHQFLLIITLAIPFFHITNIDLYEDLLYQLQIQGLQECRGKQRPKQFAQRLSSKVSMHA